MPRHRPVRGLRRPLGDVQDVRPDTPPVGQPPARRSAHRPASAQLLGQLVPQVTAGLHEQGPVDRLVRHVHHCPGREPPPQPPRDLFRRPAQLQLVLDHCPQPRPPAQLRLLRSGRPGPRGSICGQRSIAGPAAVAGDLPRERRRRPTQPGGDRSERVACSQAAGDLFPLSQAQRQLPPTPWHRPDPTGALEQVPHGRRVPAHLPRQHLHRLPRPPPTPHLIDLRRRQRRPHHQPPPHPLAEAKIMKCCDDPLRPPVDRGLDVSTGPGRWPGPVVVRVAELSQRW